MNTDSTTPVTEWYCRSRYGQLRTLKKLDDNRYKVSGRSTYMRSGGSPDSGFFIDFQGGPFIRERAKLSQIFHGAPNDVIVSISGCEDGYLFLTVPSKVSPPVVQG